MTHCDVLMTCRVTYDMCELCPCVTKDLRLQPQTIQNLATINKNSLN